MAMIEVTQAQKSFTMHLQGGIRLPVVRDATFDVRAGECVVLSGPSGVGKSSLLKMIFGNYRCDGGHITIRHRGTVVDVASAEPRQILDMRRHTIGYVSQFLRALPRVPTLDIVAEPLTANGTEKSEAQDKASRVLRRLNIPERLWSIPPSTFSGGEQQRVNIARGFTFPFPILLLDEPTASLDAANGAEVATLIDEKKSAGAAVLAIVHDPQMRERIADRVIDVTAFTALA